MPDAIQGMAAGKLPATPAASVAVTVPDLSDNGLVVLVKEAIWLERIGYAGALDNLSFAGISFRAQMEMDREEMAMLRMAEASRAARLDQENYALWSRQRRGGGDG